METKTYAQIQKALAARRDSADMIGRLYIPREIRNGIVAYLSEDGIAWEAIKAGSNLAWITKDFGQGYTVNVETIDGEYLDTYEGSDLARILSRAAAL